MFDHIPAAIICSQFDNTLGRNRPNLVGEAAEYYNQRAMKITFSLHTDFDKEDGYRHLSILIFNNGMRYVGVYSKLDWNVIANSDLTNEAEPRIKYGSDYVKGETPWVLEGFHDSCWRDAVEGVLKRFRDRIGSIDTLFNHETGWYKDIILQEADIMALARVRQATPGYGANIDSDTHRIKVEELDFKFGGKA